MSYEQVCDNNWKNKYKEMKVNIRRGSFDTHATDPDGAGTCRILFKLDRVDRWGKELKEKKRTKTECNDVCTYMHVCLCVCMCTSVAGRNGRNSLLSSA